MRKKKYKLSDLFDGVPKDKEVFPVCSMKDYVKVLRRHMADLQELINLAEEHGEGLYIPAREVFKEVENVRKNIVMSPAHRFQRMVVRAYDDISLNVHFYEEQAKEVKLTPEGEDIIRSQKPSTETADELSLVLIKNYEEGFSRLVDRD